MPFGSHTLPLYLNQTQTFAMKFFLALFLLCFNLLLPSQSKAQNLYSQTFNSTTVPALPTNWSSSSSTTQTIGQISGETTGNTLFMANCQPSGQARTVTVSNINTTGASGITVSFVHRRTSAFDVSIALAWSTDGSNWTPIGNFSPPIGTGVWEACVSDMLPMDAENQSNLRIRWSWTTNTNASCATAVPNYRIDDFSVDAATLPINLLDFQAKQQNTSVAVTFSTASEQNNRFFVIERSPDGASFSEIGRLVGAGNSKALLHYYFEDKHPLAGANYYRLQQVDFDGTASTGLVRMVLFKSFAPFTLSPCPTDGALSLSFNQSISDAAGYEVLNGNGQVVLYGSLDAETSLHVIDVGTLPAGLYAIKVLDKRNTVAKIFLRR